MKKNTDKKMRIMLIAMMMCTALLICCGCGNGSQDQSAGDSGQKQEEANDSAGSDAAAGSSEENIYEGVVRSLANAIKSDGEGTELPSDYYETLGMPSDYVYAIKDLNGDGVQELVVGTVQEQSSEPKGVPMGVYTIDKGKACLLSDLYYFRGIRKDGTILASSIKNEDTQGSGAYVIEKGTELKKVEETENDLMEFDWEYITKVTFEDVTTPEQFAGQWEGVSNPGNVMTLYKDGTFSNFYHSDSGNWTIEKNRLKITFRSSQYYLPIKTDGSFYYLMENDDGSLIVAYRKPSF